MQSNALPPSPTYVLTGEPSSQERSLDDRTRPLFFPLSLIGGESWLPSRLGACVLRRPQITYLYLNSFEPLPSFQKSTLGGARLGTLTHAARFLHGGSASMPVSFFPFAYLAGGDAPLFSRPLGLVFPPLTKWSDPRSGWHICLMVRSSLLGTDRVYGPSDHEAKRRPTRPVVSESSGVPPSPACISTIPPRTMHNS